MSPATCKDCRHHQGPQIGPENRRECRAYPPSMGREVQYHLASHPVTLATWPLTLPWDYCGGFEVIPDAVAPVEKPPSPKPAARPKPDP